MNNNNLNYFGLGFVCGIIAVKTYNFCSERFIYKDESENNQEDDFILGNIDIETLDFLLSKDSNDVIDEISSNWKLC